MPANHTDLEKTLWSAADDLRANSKLKSSEYSVPVLGLIFLRYADFRFTQAKARLAAQKTGRRTVSKTDYEAQGVLYLPDEARFSTLLNLPEGADIGKAINNAMKAVEAENETLKDVFPSTYNRLDKSILVTLLKSFSTDALTVEGDAFGRIYEYFLGKFAMTEGQKGGFVENHHKSVRELSIYGQEKVDETLKLCKMNLAVHGLEGHIKQGVTYYEDIHQSVGKFGFVMANSAGDARGSELEIRTASLISSKQECRSWLPRHLTGPIVRWLKSSPAKSVAHHCSKTPGCQWKPSQETTTLSAMRDYRPTRPLPKPWIVIRKRVSTPSRPFLAIAPRINFRRRFESSVR